jgi:hypothetical protein
MNDFVSFCLAIEPERPVTILSGVVQLSNSKDMRFYVLPSDLDIFIRLWYFNRQEVNSAIEQTLKRSISDGYKYEEDSFRAAIRKIVELSKATPHNLNALSALGGSQSSSLYNILNKHIGYTLGNRICGPKDFLLIDEASLKTFLRKRGLDDLQICDFATLFCSYLKNANYVSCVNEFSFIAALLSKPFCLLTGLSGSGKTKMAQILSSFLSGSSLALTSLKPGLIINSARASYKIVTATNDVIVLDQGDGKGFAYVPTPAISSLANAVLSGIDLDMTNPDDERNSQTSWRNSLGDPKLESICTYYRTPLKALAKYTAEHMNNSTSNTIPSYALIPVAANWTSKEDLLGYPDALQPGKEDKAGVFRATPALDILLSANANPDQPHFLILDEMNLSHVERYFADFLSAIESGEPISLHGGGKWETDQGVDVPQNVYVPKNLFIIGTVNVDETTYMFSPKVLDRANVIEFRASKDAVMGFLNNPTEVDLNSITGKGAQFAQAFVTEARQSTDLKEPYRSWLSMELAGIFETLKSHEAEFGFRVAKEVARFIQFYIRLSPETTNDLDKARLFLKAMDAQIMQKILPKMHGSQQKLKPVLDGLLIICRRKATDIVLKVGDESLKLLSADEIIYPISEEKIQRMLHKLKRDGFASFAEA